MGKHSKDQRLLKVQKLNNGIGQLFERFGKVSSKVAQWIINNEVKLKL